MLGKIAVTIVAALMAASLSVSALAQEYTVSPGAGLRHQVDRGLLDDGTGRRPCAGLKRAQGCSDNRHSSI